MRNKIELLVLPHSSHLAQASTIRCGGVWYGLLKTLMASAIEPLVSTELHRILKAEWLAAFVEAHEKAFIARNIKAGFRGTGIVPFNPSKVLNRVKSVVNEDIEVRSVTPI